MSAMTPEAKERKRAYNRQYAKERYRKRGPQIRSPEQKAVDRLRAARYRKENKERQQQRHAEYHRKNAEKINAAARVRRANNRERVRATIAAWRAAHPHYHATYEAKRRAEKLQACPLWADLSEIKKVYAKARELGLTVDHVIPLKGKTVSGLHVPGNLQLLERLANISKSNKFSHTGEFL